MFLLLSQVSPFLWRTKRLPPPRMMALESSPPASPAARLEEIAEHGRPVSFRKAIHKSKKVYDRKKLKGAGITGDDPALFR